jgi:hypothetical protein
MPAPKGNNNAGNGKLVTDALRKAVLMKQKGKGRSLDRIINAHVSKCEEGDMTAIKEAYDRLEGKVPQAVTGADGGAFIVQIAGKDASLL